MSQARQQSSGYWLRLSIVLIVALVTGLFMLWARIVSGTPKAGVDATARVTHGPAPTSSTSSASGSSATARPPSVSPTSVSKTAAQPPPVSEVPAGIAGQWVGAVVQPGSSPEQYDMALVVTSGGIGDVVGHSAYPGLHCEGDLALVQSLPQLLLRERLTLNDDSLCIDKVQVVLTVVGSQLDVRLYAANSSRRGVPLAHGLLTQIQPERKLTALDVRQGGSVPRPSSTSL